MLFGDGAGAVVVKAHETGFMDMVQWSDGRGDSVLTCGARQMKNVLVPGARRRIMLPWKDSLFSNLP